MYERCKTKRFFAKTLRMNSIAMHVHVTRTAKDPGGSSTTVLRSSHEFGDATKIRTEDETKIIQTAGQIGALSLLDIIVSDSVLFEHCFARVLWRLAIETCTRRQLVDADNVSFTTLLETRSKFIDFAGSSLSSDVQRLSEICLIVDISCVDSWQITVCSCSKVFGDITRGRYIVIVGLLSVENVFDLSWWQLQKHDCVSWAENPPWDT